MKFRNLLIVASLLGFASACAPDEGKGGLASIQGVVMQQNLNALCENAGPAFPATDYDVYISYGNSELCDDKTRTGFSGKYRFANLTKGDYTIYALSADNKQSNKFPEIVISQKVSLNSKKDEATLDTIMVYKHLDFDDGSASVSGKIILHVYSGSVELGSNPAPDYDVFLQFQNSNEIIEKTQTAKDGKYTFGNLIPGKYRLFTVSEQQLPADGDEVFSQEFEITVSGQVISLDDFNVKKY